MHYFMLLPSCLKLPIYIYIIYHYGIFEHEIHVTSSVDSLNSNLFAVIIAHSLQLLNLNTVKNAFFGRIFRLPGKASKKEEKTN